MGPRVVGRYHGPTVPTLEPPDTQEGSLKRPRQPYILPGSRVGTVDLWSRPITPGMICPVSI